MELAAAALINPSWPNNERIHMDAIPPIELQIEIAERSLIKMFPKASMISVELDVSNFPNRDGSFRRERRWNVYIAQMEGNISISSESLADAVTKAMLKSEHAVEKIAKAVQTGVLTHLGTSRISNN
jgi:hypothetical protein